MSGSVAGQLTDIELELADFDAHLDLLYAHRFAAPQGERMDIVKTAAERAYEALGYAIASNPEGQTRARLTATDDPNVSRFAARFYLAVYMLAVTRCFNAYEKRLEQDNEEARAERVRYESLKASVNVSGYAAESVRRSAEQFHRQWLSYTDTAQIKAAASAAMDLVDDYILNAMLPGLDDGPPVASQQEWNVAFKNRLAWQDARTFRFFCVALVDRHAEDPISHLNPAELPIEELRAWSGVAWIEGKVLEGEFGRALHARLGEAGVLEGTFYALTMQPVQAIDRASRWLADWEFKSEDGAVFLDPNNGHRVIYYSQLHNY